MWAAFGITATHHFLQALPYVKTSAWRFAVYTSIQFNYPEEAVSMNSGMSSERHKAKLKELKKLSIAVLYFSPSVFFFTELILVTHVVLFLLKKTYLKGY